ncbi:GCN5-related N-acetyltransferase 6, chloroplastic [Musa acuminata AAA Group]|uniref:GCN5-related N-acetyltransferase 6, chloroplastic n=1 Tax=Musa acuminata AAA Group TaxID=214697 RepID=UPI0031DB9573
MVAVVAARQAGLRRVLVFRIQDRRKPLRSFALAVMKDGSAISSDPEEDGVDFDLRSAPGFPRLEMSYSQRDLGPRIPQIEASSSRSNLRFDCLQPPDDEFDCEHRRAFGRLVAREAVLDEELWMAAWLRAESYWEERSDVRVTDQHPTESYHLQNHKRQFTVQEFNSLKKRCSRNQDEKCVCIVVVRKHEENIKHAVMKSIFGTLDLSIRHFLCGETIPGERMKPPASSNLSQTERPRYAYIANLCVAKHARRQGIATNMLSLAIEVATSYGTNQIFVDVDRDNIGAQKLYEQIGFQMVEQAGPHSPADKNYLLCLKI